MRITANQVTFARLVMMPMLCVMIYGSHGVQIAAVVLGTIVGCTDFVDGYLARMQGPTVLGALMDPIADKVFIAVGLLPLADLGWVPWWLVAVLFLREFLVTALRSSFELRRRTLRTTYLAKMKTWVQMAGIGLFLLAIVVSPAVISWVLIAFTAAPLVGWLAWRLARGTSWRGALIGTAWCAFALGMHAAGGRRWLLVGILAAVVGVTWLSGLDYLVAGAGLLRGERRVRAFDVVRVAGAVTVPFLAVAVLSFAKVPTWAPIALVALELSTGGLDNLLAHHDAAAPAWAWGARVLGASAFLAAALLVPAHAALLAILALTVSLAGTVASFVNNRRYYLDDRLREKKLAVPRAAG